MAQLAENAPMGRTPIHPARFVVEATKAFPKGGILVRDGGATVIFQWTYSQAKPHDVIWNQNFGHLGTGLPYAVGASVADGGKRPVMLLTSDSAFLFQIAELETAARQKLPLVCVVGVDHQWGSRSGSDGRSAAAAHQRALEQGRAVRQDRRGFGATAVCRKEDEIGPAIERACQRARPRSCTCHRRRRTRRRCPVRRIQNGMPRALSREE